jgi:hypothetical protein
MIDEITTERNGPKIFNQHHLGNSHAVGICCFSAKHAALRRKSKDCLARNQNNVSEWGNMSIYGLLF